MCHPGFVDAELQRLDDLTTMREQVRIFCRRRFPALLAEHGITLAWFLRQSVAKPQSGTTVSVRRPVSPSIGHLRVLSGTPYVSATGRHPAKERNDDPAGTAACC
jgi:hypothetical protein